MYHSCLVCILHNLALWLSWQNLCIHLQQWRDVCQHLNISKWLKELGYLKSIESVEMYQASMPINILKWTHLSLLELWHFLQEVYWCLWMWHCIGNLTTNTVLLFIFSEYGNLSITHSITNRQCCPLSSLAIQYNQTIFLQVLLGPNLGAESYKLKGQKFWPSQVCWSHLYEHWDAWYPSSSIGHWLHWVFLMI